MQLSPSQRTLTMKEKVIIDCNIKKPSLHQIGQAEFSHKKNFFYGYEYYRSALKDCLSCGTCRSVCENNAINSEFEIDPDRCTGCAKCQQVCPNQAIERIEKLAGYCFFSECPENIYIQGELNPGAHCAEELLNFIKKEGQTLAQRNGIKSIIINEPIRKEAHP